MKAPFTDEQVARIEAWQADKYVHALTCGREDCRMTLDVTEDGLVCPLCGYTQDWVHDCIANPISPYIFEKPIKTDELYLPRQIQGLYIWLWRGEKYVNRLEDFGESPFLWHINERYEYPAIICKCGCSMFELNSAYGYSQMARCIHCGKEDEIYNG